MVLGSIELIFFIEACVVLCSGFLVNTVVRIHWCFSCCRVKERLGVCKELGGWIDEKDAPSCMASHSATKKEEGTRAAMTFVLPRYHCTCWSLHSWKWLHTCLLMGSSKWIPPVLLSLLQPTSSPTFTCPTLEEWVSSCMVLSCQQDWTTALCFSDMVLTDLWFGGFSILRNCISKIRGVSQQDLHDTAQRVPP